MHAPRQAPSRACAVCLYTGQLRRSRVPAGGPAAMITAQPSLTDTLLFAHRTAPHVQTISPMAVQRALCCAVSTDRLSQIPISHSTPPSLFPLPLSVSLSLSLSLSLPLHACNERAHARTHARAHAYFCCRSTDSGSPAAALQRSVRGHEARPCATARSPAHAPAP